MKLALLALWATVSLVQGYRILCVFPVPTASHNILGKGFVNALLQAGHQVWWATPYPDKVKQQTDNLTIIDVSATKVVFKDIKMSQTSITTTFHLGPDIAALAARAPEMTRAMLDNNFDAVVTEWFLTDLPAGYAAVQGVPWIMLSSVAAHPYLEHLVDEITSPPIIPNFMCPAPIPMNFWQRVANTVVVGWLMLGSWALRNDNSYIYDDIFGPLASERGTTLPPLTEAYNNISVVLVNSHPILAPVHSFPPNVVDIAGFHVEETPLPEDWQQLLDTSPGFIFFSLGSVVMMSELSAAVKVELKSMFSELPYTVLWRSDEPITGLPGHVHVREWFPQAGILAHRKCKLFITHGGLLSTIEALHHGVPLLMVPVFGDQPLNADHAAAAGLAVKVDFQDMAKGMRGALHEILANDSYYKTARHLSKLFRSRPVEPTRLVSHYVELAIESRGAPHLRSPKRHYAWYQRAYLDQLLAFGALCYAVYVAARLACRRPKRKKE